MQERTRLDNAIQGVRHLETEMQDHIDLIALGEEEGDAEVVKDAEQALLALQKTVEKK